MVWNLYTYIHGKQRDSMLSHQQLSISADRSLSSQESNRLYQLAAPFQWLQLPLGNQTSSTNEISTNVQQLESHKGSMHYQLASCKQHTKDEPWRGNERVRRFDCCKIQLKESQLARGQHTHETLLLMPKVSQTLLLADIAQTRPTCHLRSYSYKGPQDLQKTPRCSTMVFIP